MQLTFAAFNFKSSSNDQDGRWKKIPTHADSLQACPPPQKKIKSASILMAQPV